MNYKNRAKELAELFAAHNDEPLTRIELQHCLHSLQDITPHLKTSFETARGSSTSVLFTPMAFSVIAREKQHNATVDVCEPPKYSKTALSILNVLNDNVRKKEEYLEQFSELPSYYFDINLAAGAHGDCMTFIPTELPSFNFVV